MNHWLIRCFSNCLEWVDLSWCDLGQHELSWNICGSKLQIFHVQIFQLNKNIFALSIFEKIVASKVFTLTFFCDMPQQAPVGDIRRFSDGVKYVAVTLPGPGNLWVWTSNGSCICLVFVVRKCLMIFLTPILFLLWITLSLPTLMSATF